jgi:hypothetical protein
MLTAPPSSSPAVEPAEIVTAPPIALPDSPTERVKSPALPLLELPVDIAIEPDDPEVASPVLMVTPPLAPVSPDSPLDKLTEPLDA